MLSTDNLNRPEEQLVPLLGIIENAVRALAADGRWRVNHVGTMDLLPARTQSVLKEAEQATHANTGILVNVAVGYGGRQEIADAVRSLLLEHAERGRASRSSPRSSTSSTSRSTCTRAASPTPTW